MPSLRPIRSLVSIVRFDQLQGLLYNITANKLNVACFRFVVDHPDFFQLWEMGVVKRNLNALSMFIGNPLYIFISIHVCNAVYERVVIQCLLRCAVQGINNSASLFVRYYR